MSYIDTFDHEFVGFFGRLPVYHPLVVHTDDDDGFSCSPDNLVIGGGSGEHPAVVLASAERAVASFVLDWMEDANKDHNRLTGDVKTNMEAWDLWSIDRLDEVTISQALIFEHRRWNVERYHGFFEMCCSPAMHTPLKPGISLEEWLLASFGEFILLTMPELVPNLEVHLAGLRNVAYPLYTNILLPPPGYRVFAGRRVINGKLVYGQRWFPSEK